MQIPWFAYAYGVFVPWQEALFARIRASWPWRYGRILKWRAEQYVRTFWNTAASAAASALARFRTAGACHRLENAACSARDGGHASRRRLNAASRAGCRRRMRAPRRR